MKKSGILGALSLLLLAAAAAPAQVTTMRLNYVAPATHPTSLTVQHWVQQVEKRSNGKIRVRVHWAMELSTVMETLQTLGGGAYEIGFNAPGFFPAQFPLASMPSGMMGLNSTVPQAQYYYQEVNNMPEVTAEATANNLKFLYANAASNYLPISRKPITKISDLKGNKVRTFGPYFPKHVRQFGGTAVAIPSVEAYDAFASGAMDVFPSMATDHVVFKFAQIAKNLWELKMGTLPWAVMYMNLGTWNKLPKDMQDVFTQASVDALKFSAEMWARREPEELAKLKQAGVTFHPASQADQAAWNAHTRILLNEWVEDMNKVGKGDAARRMVALVDEIRAKYPD